MDIATIIAVTSSVTALVTSTLTVLLTKGTDAWVKWRKAKHEIEYTVCLADDERADKSYKSIIEQLNQRIVALEAEIITLRTLRDADLRATAKQELESQRQILHLQWQLDHPQQHASPASTPET
jgi:hypothetical protein